MKDFGSRLTVFLLRGVGGYKIDTLIIIYLMYEIETGTAKRTAERGI